MQTFELWERLYSSSNKFDELLQEGKLLSNADLDLYQRNKLYQPLHLPFLESSARLEQKFFLLEDMRGKHERKKIFTFNWLHKDIFFTWVQKMEMR